MLYSVQVGWTPAGNPRIVKFSTLEAACKFCQEVFARTGIVLGITETHTPRTAADGSTARTGADPAIPRR